jgi:leucyl-tRNA synthetase
MTNRSGRSEPSANNFGQIEPYNPQHIEPGWQAQWQRTQLYEVDLRQASRPFYNLMMFPYPSAEGLHVGNVYAFTGSDIYGRFKAMQGWDVFEPMGFDAFGIHSENFAIQRGIHPRILTARNVERFRETQLKRIGNRFAWSHEVNTTHPAYYKWTQWIFVKLFKAGLVVRKKAPVNWCPKDKTVLADEQVIAGRCERCGTLVVQRELEQWFFKITSYAQRLLDNLNRLDWSALIKTAQRNWIGRSEGLTFDLLVEEYPEEKITVFTTRPDTVFGMTYVVLAPEHPLVDRLTTADRRPAIQAYQQAARRKSELERLTAVRQKTGEFLGAYAINPLNHQRVPIWIADYVLLTYGSGAIMAVPAHDKRDFEFAQTVGLPIVQVVIPASLGDSLHGDTGGRMHEAADLKEAYTDAGVLVNSGPFSGLPSEEAAHKIIEWFEARKLGERTVQYRLRDWLVSRQRYWGPPIPIIYCDACGTVPVPEDQLPVLLPDLEDWLPTGTGSSPLAKLPEFVTTTCPACAGPARRETDVSDNFFDSAWYFLRYPSVGLDDRPFDAELTGKWLPVDMYVGGPEHSVLHLLYSRFITLALHDLGYLPFEEPFERFRAHGHITKDGAKMSKSHGNVVNPDMYLERFGADTLRLYLMFLGPYDQGGDFTDRGMGGVHRFLNRLWNLLLRNAGTLQLAAPPRKERQDLHRTIQKVAEDLQSLKYNTAIAALMEYLNTLQSRSVLYEEEVLNLLLMLAPFAPYITEELWHRLGKPYSIHQQAFPQPDPDLLIREKVSVALQINGRTRGQLELSPNASEEEAVEAAKQLPSVQSHLREASIKRVVYVPSRIINIVI